ncbi:hypothetical protein LCGC14_2034800, partial [marine sediment metagenome]
MRIITVLGTRPEIIRLSVIIKKLDKFNDHILIHTGQNYDPRLSDIFFEDLELRKPDYYLGARSESFGEQLSISSQLQNLDPSMLVDANGKRLDESTMIKNILDEGAIKFSDPN